MIIKILLFYILVTIFIAIKNCINFARCIYIELKLKDNYSNGKNVNNYYLADSLNSLLCKANVSVVPAKELRDSFSAPKVFDHILRARAKYRHRMIHSYCWVINLFSHMRIFSFNITRIENKLLRFIFCIAEWLVLYLVGLFLDTSGIGNKILSHLIAFLHNTKDTLLQ